MITNREQRMRDIVARLRGVPLVQLLQAGHFTKNPAGAF
jgi:hypothetical protein